MFSVVPGLPARDVRVCRRIVISSYDNRFLKGSYVICSCQHGNKRAKESSRLPEFR